MLDLIPPWLDSRLSVVISPISRALSRWGGGDDKPICAQVGPLWAFFIGRKHCAASRKEWNSDTST